ncbi:MAG TPA: signal peptidase I [Candidatus Acidoferrum sp.]|nr:signal peptidase I [Candidatus Acidoferrum sp.]
MTNSATTLAETDRVCAHGRRSFYSLLRQAFQISSFFLLVVCSYLLISHFLLQTVKVVGRSMNPTLSDSQRCLLNLWIYRFHDPQRSEIVVLRDPGDNGFSVKRIVARPGDSVYLKDGSVYLNGCKLDEPYLAPNTPTFSNSNFKDQLIVCGKDQYYLLGDNRLNSVDSRSYGPVPRANLLGPLMR